MVHRRIAPLLFIATALTGCAGSPGDSADAADPRDQATRCSGTAAAANPVHYATGTFDLALAPDADEGHPDAVPPSEDWRLAVHYEDLENVQFTTVVGCAFTEEAERWTVTVKVATQGAVVGDPVLLNTGSTEEVPYLLGSLAWRDTSEAVVGIQYFGGAFAAGGDAQTTLHDQAARALQATYSGYVELAMDLQWEEDPF